MKVCLAQIDTVVGDFDGNVAKVLAVCGRAASERADLVVFPELTLTGYPPMDLLERSAFIEANLRAFERVRAESRGLDPAVVIGFAEVNRTSAGKPLFNSAAVIQRGVVIGVHRKVLLPAYDVFDENRYFEPGPVPSPIQVFRTDHCNAEAPENRSVRLGVTICEDIWNDKAVWRDAPYREEPVRALAASGIDILVNLSASPFVVGKMRTRLELASRIAKRYGIPVVYVNLVGGNDGLIFDGESFVLGPDGGCRACAAAFREDCVIASVGPAGDANLVTPPTMDLDEPGAILEALCLGVRDYVSKLGIGSVIVGLSGGIDSAVTAAIAVRALGPQRVLAVTMPSRFTSASALEGARSLARNLGIRLEEIRIDPVVEAFVQALRPTLGDPPWGLTEENLQARTRGTLLMAISNHSGALVLNTGNKSELAVGYCTLYGDMVGGLAVIGDLSKQAVYEVARRINRERPVIPEDTLTRPPSAELRPDQKDEDSLPPYPTLDPIVRGYVEDGLDADALVKAGHAADVIATVLAMISRAEFKRRQAPIALKVTARAFGVGRRFPIVQKFEDRPYLLADRKGGQ